MGESPLWELQYSDPMHDATRDRASSLLMVGTKGSWDTIVRRTMEPMPSFRLELLSKHSIRDPSLGLNEPSAPS